VAQAQLAQILAIPDVVRITKEARLTIVSALHDVLHNAGNIESGLARHGILQGRTAACRHAPTPSSAIPLAAG
jgi:hypothetical protein